MSARLVSPHPCPGFADASRMCCSGDCNQGRSCPVREACQIAEVDRFDSDGRSMLWWLLGVPAAVVAIGLVAVFA